MDFGSDIRCLEPRCWGHAVAYTTNKRHPPAPWAGYPDEPPPKTPWYACEAHTAPEFRPLTEGHFKEPPVCEQCGHDEGIEWESSRTMYDTRPLNYWQHLLVNLDLQKPDPNRPIAYCRDCAEDHHLCWDAQWAEHYSSCY